MSGAKNTEAVSCRPQNDTEIGVAVLGYGVVGKGVANAIRTNANAVCKKTGLRLTLRRVLDLLDFPDSPDAALITHKVGDVMGDARVGIVVETMGGTGAALEFTKMAFAKKKHVVTSNKELVAEHGPELLALASEHGVSYRFEASVGGGVPILRPLEECLAANGITGITGIVNGTTNYMLTYMKEHGADFAETLRGAQEKGYAEKDPSADIEGHDACRKLAILLSVAGGAFVDWKKIHTEGIARVTQEDIGRAADLGRVVRLIASGRFAECGVVEALVAPMLVDRHSPLACAEGVNNAIMVHGDLVGDVMFYGQGAGMTPTASAILADILKIAGGPAPDVQISEDVRWDRAREAVVADAATLAFRFYARIRTVDRSAFTEALFREFPDAGLLPRRGDDNGDGGSGDDGGNGYGGEGGGHALAFTVGPVAGGLFAERLNRIIKSVPGTEAGIAMRFL
ncbi:MAG: homoserine dehydrogenase [Clostridiales bacterium]|nr:homoserine dehydrogenase [Clostridiales bacterium]